MKLYPLARPRIAFLIAMLTAATAFSNAGTVTNFSVRAEVATKPLIQGVATNGSVCLLLIRAIGPSLAQFGVQQPLQRPLLTAYDSKGKLIGRGVPMKELNSYQRYLLSIATDLGGAFPLPLDTNDQVMMLLVTRPVTFHVVGGNGEKGEVLVEGYWQPNIYIDFPPEIYLPGE